MAWNQTFCSLGGAIALTALLPAFKAIAQISPDGTTATMIEATENRLTIEGGDRAGGNLFHSFREFSIPTGGEAYFNNAIDVANIFSRVTGGQISNIDGLIRANGTANLFLLNPAGIIFGPNARLDLGGSFFGTTARSIQFADGVEFAADFPTTTPLLTMSVPVGLQFGADPGAIQVYGNGYRFPQQSIDELPGRARQARIEATQRILTESTGLQVVPGKTLALIGAAVTLDRAALKASDGRIAIGAVAANQQINFATDQLGFAIDLPPIPETEITADSPQKISVRDSLILTSGEGGGEILVWGDRVSIEGFSNPSSQEQSRISADTLGLLPGRQIGISTGFLNLRNSILTTEQFSNNGQKSGNISINAGAINLFDSSLSSSVRGQGQSGNIIIVVRDIARFDDLPSSLTRSGVFSQIRPGAGGQAGNIYFSARSLFLANSAQISSSTFGRGDAGYIDVAIFDQLEASGFNQAQGLKGSIAEYPSGILSNVLSGGSGNAGRIIVNANSLSIRDGAQISSGTVGNGNAGSVNVTVLNQIEVEGFSELQDIEGRTLIFPSGIFSAVSPGGNGNAGSVIVRANSISLRDNTRISSEVQGKGDAGSVIVYANSISLRNNGRIASTASSTGNAGSVNVTVRDRLDAEGFTQFPDAEGTLVKFPSGVFSSVERGLSGNAGSVNIDAGSISLRGGAQIASSNDVGGFAAGNVVLNASTIDLDDDAKISAETLGDQGNIRLRSESLVLRRGSEILTNAQQASAGGNITIETQTLTALENSDITANAENASGGQITIRSRGIFGTAFRNATTPDSDITASSALGAEFSGTVQINTPTIDPSAGLLVIATNLTDISDRLNQTFCHDVARSGGSFTITGRGGIAATPDAFLDDLGSVAIAPLEPIARSSALPDRPLSAPDRPPPGPIIEANTWRREADGRLVLMAQGPAIAPPGLRLRDCPLPSTSAP